MAVNLWKESVIVFIKRNTLLIIHSIPQFHTHLKYLLLLDLSALLTVVDC